MQETLDLIRPYKTKFSKIRLGPPYDGGYVVVNNNLADLDYILTFGIGPSIEFERQLKLHIANKCEIYACDPNVDLLQVFDAHRDVNPHLISKGLGPICSEDYASLRWFKEDLKLHGRGILKVDIEGHEWNTFIDIKPEELASFEQILLECHFYGGKEELKIADVPKFVINTALKNVLVNHRLVHIHGNNWEPFLKIDEVLFPHCFELTFLRRDLDDTNVPDDSYFPTPLDVPNKPGFPDLQLGSWPFQ